MSENLPSRKPVVALVGRTNVGKSTLFNRLTRERRAVVHLLPHVTRDRLFGEVPGKQRPFLLVDTGGIGEPADDPLQKAVETQARFAIEEADLVVLVTDALETITGRDYAVADLLRRSGKPVLLVANKAESPRADAEQFYALRLGEPLAVSAKTGRNANALLVAIRERLPALPPPTEPAPGTVRRAVVGRPNVGKSSLVNALLGQERMLVHEAPGTTRDAVDSCFSYDGREIVIVDTAGIRRKPRVKEALDYYSTLRSYQAIGRCDVALIVLEGPVGITAQDQRIAGHAHEAGKGCIVVVNKWDLVERLSRQSGKAIARQAQRDYERMLHTRLSFIAYAPIIFASAASGAGVPPIPSAALQVAEARSRRVPTAEVNRALMAATQAHQPPTRGSRSLKIRYATQAETKPPRFVLFANDPELMSAAYLRYLEKSLRASLGFARAPIYFVLRQSPSTRRGQERRPER